MSKFIDSIKAQFTGERKAGLDLLTASVRPDPLSIQNYTELRQYNIGVHYGVKIYCEPKDLYASIDNVVRQLRADIYGEFGNDLLRLERAVFSHDLNEARSIIRDMTKEIFG